MNKYIEVKGAKVNNLKDINVKIPQGQVEWPNQRSISSKDFPLP